MCSSRLALNLAFRMPLRGLLDDEDSETGDIESVVEIFRQSIARLFLFK